MAAKKGSKKQPISFLDLIRKFEPIDARCPLSMALSRHILSKRGLNTIPERGPRKSTVNGISTITGNNGWIVDRKGDNVLFSVLSGQLTHHDSVHKEGMKEVEEGAASISQTLSPKGD